MTTEALSSLKEKFKELDFPQRPAYTCQDITITGYDLPKTGLHQKFTQEHLRNRVSYTAHLEKGKIDTLLTAYSYDPHGNVKSLLQQIPGLPHKITSYRYDQISGNVNYVFYQPGTAEQLVHHYTYDADNRIETVQTSTDGYLWSTDATYYYYPHGPLTRVELGEHKVQGLDYYYTLQGWLKGVNMPRGGDPGRDGIGAMRTGKDAMAFALGYYSGDYAPITTGTILTDIRDALWSRTSTINTNTGVYNGNITWMNTELAGSQDQYDMQAMVYKYDQLHRIVQARSLREYTTNFTSRTATTAKAYDATYTYDPNGNLLTLQRRNAAAAFQDNLVYGYYANSNKLRQTASAQGDNYIYDQIGNLTKDVGDGITNIEWTPSGKVRKVTKSSGSPIEFRYDASGNRVEKKQGTAITRYVLAVVSDRIHMDSLNTWAEVISRSDYYPFGLAMTGRTESSGYRYGFNGKEKDNPSMGGGGNTYDYGFRIYNPNIAKFLSVDPLTKSFPMLTPYQYASNNPILNIDLDGLEGIPAPVAEFGYYIEQKTLNAFEVVEENSWKTWHIVMGVGKGLYNVLGSIGPQARVVNINDPSPSLIEEFIDPIVNFPAQVQDVYENGTLEEKAQLSTELGFAALTMARSVKGFSLRNFPNSKGISLKDNTPQVGAAFESFAANISRGRINLSGRAVINGTFDFVITNSGELKVGFGHSLLSGGSESVKAAGQLSFFKGKVQTITNNSGHYKPSVSEGQGFGELLKQGGVDVSNTKLKLYNSSGSLESTSILK